MSLCPGTGIGLSGRSENHPPSGEGDFFSLSLLGFGNKIKFQPEVGRGSAGEAARRIPGIQKECAEAIRRSGHRLDGTEDYGFLVVRPPSERRIGFGIFQVKRHWRDVARLETIVYSLDALYDYAVNNKNVKIRAVVPGLGCGRIGRCDPIDPQRIYELLNNLPDNVTFCIRPTDTVR